MHHERSRRSPGRARLRQAEGLDPGRLLGQADRQAWSYLSYVDKGGRWTLTRRPCAGRLRERTLGARHGGGFSWEQAYTIGNRYHADRSRKPDLRCARLFWRSDRKVVAVCDWATALRPELYIAATILEGGRAARLWHRAVGVRFERLDRAVGSSLSDNARDHSEEDAATAR
jgi:hypothetical protein